MIQVVNRALGILEYCAKHPEKIHSLADIANHFGLNHATCTNILKTLVHRKYIEQVGYKNEYRLGSMSYNLTKNITFRNNLVEIAQPVMKDLCDILNETVVVAVYNKQDNTRVILHTEYCNHELQVYTGKEKNAYETAIGRLIIAHMSEEERMDIVLNNELPPFSVWEEASSSIEDFERELEKIREKGIAFQTAASEYVIGVAAPVFYQDRVVAGFAINLPVVRFVCELKTLIVDLVIHDAKKLTEQLYESTTC